MDSKEQRAFPYVVAAATNTERNGGGVPCVSVARWKKATKTRPAIIQKDAAPSPVGVPVVSKWEVYKQAEGPLSDVECEGVQTYTRGNKTLPLAVPYRAVVAGSFRDLGEAAKIAAGLNAKPTGFRFDAESAEKFAVESADGDAPQDFRQLGLFDAPA